MKNTIKVKHILVSIDTFEKYYSIHKTNRLDKFLKIYTFGRFNAREIFESFDKDYPDTEYEMKPFTFDEKWTNYKDEDGNKIRDGYKIWFETNSKTKYRIDLIPIKNFNPNINSKFVWSISFTLDKYEVGNSHYEELTELNETKEVLIRIGNILNQIDIPKYFVIGNTDEENKIELYEDFILYVFKAYNIEMSYCEGFKDNKGLYIWL